MSLARRSAIVSAREPVSARPIEAIGRAPDRVGSVMILPSPTSIIVIEVTTSLDSSPAERAPSKPNQYGDSPSLPSAESTPRACKGASMTQAASAPLTEDIDVSEMTREELIAHNLKVVEAHFHNENPGSIDKAIA